MNTSGVESFTEDFAKEYFSWKNNKEAIEKRMSNLEQYLTENGLALIQDMVRADKKVHFFMFFSDICAF
ncbi:hypothetical protein EfmAA242_30100 [Enterococcus faecium]|nr:hypothetical protein EfmAA242_30100 [Enterococcus faecium]